MSCGTKLRSPRRDQNSWLEQDSSDVLLVNMLVVVAVMDYIVGTICI